MRRFRSPATRLLALARQRQRLRELLLARAQAQAAAARDRRDAAARAVDAATQSLTTALHVPGSAAGFIALQSHLLCATNQEAERSVECSAATAQVQAALQALQTERSKVRSLEFLEERHQQAHRRQLLQFEETQRDEQRTCRAGRASLSTKQVTHA